MSSVREGLGLGQYAEAFEANDVDLALLPKLTGDDLREIGVASVGHRRRLLEAVESLNAQASSEPETAVAETAWFCLIDMIDLTPGQTVLVQGGTGGAGHVAVQLAKWRGAKVYATCGSDEKRRIAESLGGEAAYNYETSTPAATVSTMCSTRRGCRRSIRRCRRSRTSALSSTF